MLKKTCHAVDVSRQNSQPAEHMPVDELRLCRIFRFLAEFFHSGNATPLFGLLHTVSNKNMKPSFLIQRKEPENRLKPALPYPVQGPGGGTEEMEHGQITVRFQGEVTDYGSDSEFIGTEHQPDGENHKPAKSRFSGETGFKRG